jgi:predicted GNAT family acetyltransferase
MILDHPERHRYELAIDGKKAAEIVYHMRGPGTIELVHTEVQPGCEGQGLASKLATFALDDARQRGLKVIPSCSYIGAFVGKHPEYADLLSPRPSPG